jgi:hypothetical protein
MRILLDCRPLQLAGSAGEKYRLIVSAVAAISRDRSVEWLLLVDHTYRPGLLPGLVPIQPDAQPGQSGSSADPAILPGDHVQPPSGATTDRARLLTARSLPGTLGWKLWYDWQLPRLVKRHKPDLLMLTGGVTARPSGVRQCIWMPVFANPKEAASAATPEGPIVPIYAARLGNSVRQAENIICFSEKDRSWLAARGHIEAANILVVRPSPFPGTHPLSADEKEAIRYRYTGGKEFFFISRAGIGTGAAAGAGEEHMVQLLKAFSLFKKRQLTNLQLVMEGAQTEAIRQRLETYKYRSDIHWVVTGAEDPAAGDGAGNSEAAPGAPHSLAWVDAARHMAGANPNDLLSAAYAVLFPFEDGSLGTTLLNAWKAGIPALVARNSRLREMADDASLIAGIDDPAALAGYMMSVYKDETHRTALIEKGTARLTDFDPSPSLAAVQTVVGREINKIN